MDIVIAVMKYAYLALLWAFVISVVALIRRDVFGAKLASASTSAISASHHTPKLAAGVSSAAISAPAPTTPAHHLHPSTSLPAQQMNSDVMPTGLLVTSGIAEGDFFDLHGFEITVGRGASNIVQLNDSFVSNKHARIFEKGTHYFVEDLGSTNGTNLDGKKIKHAAQAYFGSKISIGNNTMEFV